VSGAFGAIEAASGTGDRLSVLRVDWRLLPAHKQGDRAKSFSINVRDNYWRCFSASCNENNGGKRAAMSSTLSP
jgi:hypothetical protein